MWGAGPGPWGALSGRPAGLSITYVGFRPCAGPPGPALSFEEPRLSTTATGRRGVGRGPGDRSQLMQVLIPARIFAPSHRRLENGAQLHARLRPASFSRIAIGTRSGAAD